MFKRHSAISLAGFAAASLMLLSSCSPPEGAQTGASATELSDAASNKGQAFVQDEGSRPNILQIALGSPDHSTLVAAVQAAELENVLVNQGPLTVFAPTNDAFGALPEGTVEDLLKPENKAALAKIVTSHAAPGKYTTEQLHQLMERELQLYQATGHYVAIEVRDGDTYVNGAKILGTVDATNGIVHVVDQVFLIAAN
jgi:uncharacterized surface protein with fasciclin (FAS1) repeats